MTERQLFEFYLICAAVGAIALYFSQHWLGAVGGFIAAAALQTYDSETRKRP